MRIIDGSAIALEELDPDQRIAARTAEHWLLRNGENCAIRNDVYGDTRVGGVSALEVVAEKQPRFQAGKRDATTDIDVRSRIVLTAQSANQKSRNGIIQEVAWDFQPLHAAAKEHGIGQIAVLIVELDPDVRVAANATENGLFGDDDFLTEGNQDNIGIERDDRLMSSFDIVGQDQFQLNTTEGNIAINGNLRSRRVIAPGFIDIGGDVNGLIEFSHYLLIRASGGEAEVEHGEQSSAGSDGLD